MGIFAGTNVRGCNSFSMWEGGLNEHWSYGNREYAHCFYVINQLPKPEPTITSCYVDAWGSSQLGLPAKAQ